MKDRKERQRLYNRRAYAKKIGLSMAEFEEMEREREERRKNKVKGRPGPNQEQDRMWEKLKIKHKEFEGTRLEKSLKPYKPMTFKV